MKSSWFKLLLHSLALSIHQEVNGTLLQRVGRFYTLIY